MKTEISTNDAAQVVKHCVWSVMHAACGVLHAAHCRWWAPTVVPEFKLEPYPHVVSYMERWALVKHAFGGGAASCMMNCCAIVALMVHPKTTRT